MRSESMVVALGRSDTEAGKQKHLLARLERLGRMALWSRHQVNIWESMLSSKFQNVGIGNN